MRRLPLAPTPVDESLLDDIGVAAPCDADWSRMRGDDRVRHCADCRQNVYDLSAMTRREAVELIREREGRLCVRLLRRTDGTLVTRDCRELLARARRRGRAAWAAALVVVGLIRLGLGAGVLYGLLSGWLGAEPPVAPAPLGTPRPMVMGVIAAPPLPAPPHPIKGKLKLVPRPAPAVRCDPNDPLCDTLD